MILELVLDAFPVIGVGGRVALARDVGPVFGELGIEFEELGRRVVTIRLNRFDRALRFADAAIDTFFRMNDQHVFALVEAIHRANFDAIHIFALDAIFCNDVGHSCLRSFPANAWPRAWLAKSLLSRDGVRNGEMSRAPPIFTSSRARATQRRLSLLARGAAIAVGHMNQPADAPQKLVFKRVDRTIGQRHFP